MGVNVLAVRREEGATVLLRPSPSELPALLRDESVVVWVNLDGRDAEAEATLRDVFDFHPLLIEDAFADATTPKLEDFGEYLYLIVHGLSDADPGDGEVQTADLDLFLGERYLITHYRVPFDAISMAKAAIDRDPSLLARGPAVIAHRVIDRLVDEFLPLMEKLDQEVDAIEEAILGSSAERLLERVFRMKHSLNRIRRVGTHQKRLLAQLAHEERPLIPEEVRPFFRDVYDHMVRVQDLNEVYRDLVANALDGFLGMQSHKLNEVMRVLTIFSTVMLPLTFITGLYGMNFEYIPYLHFEYGFEGAMISMGIIAIAMLAFFKQRGWV